VAVEIEINPLLGTASFRAAEQVTVESTGHGNVVNGEREMKRDAGGGAPGSMPMLLRVIPD